MAGTRTACQIELSYLAPGPCSQSWGCTLPGRPVLYTCTSTPVMLMPGCCICRSFQGVFCFCFFCETCTPLQDQTCGLHSPHGGTTDPSFFKSLPSCSADVAAMLVVSFWPVWSYRHTLMQICFMLFIFLFKWSNSPTTLPPFHLTVFANPFALHDSYRDICCVWAYIPGFQSFIYRKQMSPLP